MRTGHKYGATPTVVDNIRFASKKEATRYSELKLLEKAGEIWDLELQPRFPLCAPLTTGTLAGALRAVKEATVLIGEYRADFKYHDRHTAAYVVEDVKGFKTPLYRWKRKHVEAQYGVKIHEI